MPNYKLATEGTLKGLYDIHAKTPC